MPNYTPKTFSKKDLKKLFIPKKDSSGEDNGQVTIIGGSKLFHGAPLLSLKVASRIVDMVFFATPEPSVGRVAELIKSNLLSFIWVPWGEVEAYIKKSDAVLIGPGFMRYGKETQRRKFSIKKGSLISKIFDREGSKTRKITKSLLTKFPDKKWVIDAGSLQVMDAEWIPKGSILTPNKKEFEILFGVNIEDLENKARSRDEIANIVSSFAERYKCTIVLKGPETIVASPDDLILVKGGNAGLTKGGTGDTLAGLTVALFAKNNSFLAAAAASFIIKETADCLFEKVGTYYSADVLVTEIFPTLYSFSFRR